MNNPLSQQELSSYSELIKYYKNRLKENNVSTFKRTNTTDSDTQSKNIRIN